MLVAAESRFELPSPPFAHLKEFEATHARQVSDPFSFPSLSSATAKARASCMRQLQDYLQALLRLLVEEAQLQQEMSNVTRDTTGTVQSSLPSGDTSAMQAEVLTELLGRVRCFFAAAAGGSLGTQQDLVIGWTVRCHSTCSLTHNHGSVPHVPWLKVRVVGLLLVSGRQGGRGKQRLTGGLVPNPGRAVPWVRCRSVQQQFPGDREGLHDVPLPRGSLLHGRLLRRRTTCTPSD